MDAWLAMMRQVQEHASGAGAETALGDGPPSLIAAMIQRGLGALAEEGAALAEGEDLETVVERLLPRLREALDQLRALHRNASEAALLPVELTSAALGHLAALQSLYPLASQSPAGAGPRLGIFQDYQTRLEAVASAAERYRDATEGYAALLGEVAEKSLEEFQRRARERDREEQATPSLRELYGLWVAAGEAAYEEVLRGESYSQAFGELTNAAVELSQSLQQLWDDFLETLGLPSRRELDATQQRLEQVRRRGEAENRQLRREMETLRRELFALATATAEPAGLHQPRGGSQ